MVRRTRQSRLTPQQWTFDGITTGIVVDANDPQQMGRIRATCVSLGDRLDIPITDVPWCSYASPFAGTTQVGTRGAGSDPAVKSTGPISYGMWAIPKVGAQVLIMCLDGDPQTRIWVGCLPTQFTPHTMPHGRYTYKDPNTDGLPSGANSRPVGPLTGFEGKIQPLSDNFRSAFGEQPAGDHNFEFASRAADFQAAGITDEQVLATLSNVSDDTDESTEVPNSTLIESRQGYQTNRQAPDQFVSEELGTKSKNLDNMVTAIVSPGFHAVSMDDREENCRIRVRTVGGHQIIFDDSNERIYISTAKGENWIEIDEAGNIDIYTSGKLSAHAKEDINFTTDSSFRVYAKKGIQLKSDLEVRVTAEQDVSIKSLQGAGRFRSKNDILIESEEQDVHLNAGIDIYETAGQNIHIKGGNNTTIEAAKEGNYKTGDALRIQSGAKMDLLGGGNITLQSPKVDLNPGSAASAGNADPANQADQNNDFNAFFTNRIPDHEPWARVDTENDNTITPQYTYEEALVGRRRRITGADGKSSTTEEIVRGTNWRR